MVDLTDGVNRGMGSKCYFNFVKELPKIGSDFEECHLIKDNDLYKYVYLNNKWNLVTKPKPQLELPYIDNNLRQIGNTTRQADYYIQLLFEEKEITVIDHYDRTHDTNDNYNSKRLFAIIQDRLRHEHSKNIFNFDFKNLKITL